MPGAPAITTLQRSRWRAAGGQELEGVLSSGAVAVVDAGYLIGVSTRDGEVLRHRQALPPEAFLSLEQMIAMTPLSQDVLLPIIVVSCAWLHPQHPDPLGAHLHTLAAALGLALALDRLLLNPDRLLQVAPGWSPFLDLGLELLLRRNHVVKVVVGRAIRAPGVVLIAASSRLAHAARLPHCQKRGWLRETKPSGEGCRLHSS